MSSRISAMLSKIIGEGGMDITQAEPRIRRDDLIGAHSQVFVPHDDIHDAVAAPDNARFTPTNSRCLSDAICNDGSEVFKKLKPALGVNEHLKCTRIRRRLRRTASQM